MNKKEYKIYRAILYEYILFMNVKKKSSQAEKTIIKKNFLHSFEKVLEIIEERNNE